MMEEFLIRNYIFHNLRDMIIKMNKMYPHLITNEYLKNELEYIQKYITSIKFTNTSDTLNSTVCKGLQAQGNVTTSTSFLNPSNVGLKLNVGCIPLLTFDISQFQLLPPKNDNQLQKVVIPKTNQQSSETVKIMVCRCAARIVSSTRNAMPYDYISYLDNTTTPIYGRQCKNMRIDGELFCGIHKKKCEYGVFAEEPSPEIKELCLKKYTRIMEKEKHLKLN